MERTRIRDTNHPLFGRAWELYGNSFPPQERRLIRTQRGIMNDARYRFELITDGALFVGFILWWGYDTIYNGLSGLFRFV